MSGPLPDVWYRRDFPVLIELARRFDASSEYVNPSTIEASLGMTYDEVQAALHALVRRGLIDAMVQGTAGGQRFVLTVKNVAGKAYLLTGLHPDGETDLDALIDAIRQAADREPEPEQRSKLRRAAEGLRDASSDVLGQALAAYIAARIPT